MRKLLTATGWVERCRDGAVLLVCLLHWRYGVDLSLVADGGLLVGHTVYSRDVLWLSDQWAAAGAPLKLTAAWLVQWYGLPWAGPLILTAATALLLAAGEWFGRTVAGRAVAGYRYVAPLLLVVLHNNHATHLEQGLGAAVALAAAAGYRHLAPAQPGRRGLLAMLLLAGAYVLLGGSYLVLLAVLVLGELRGGVRVWGLLLLVWGEALPWMWVRLHADTEFVRAYLAALPVLSWPPHVLALVLLLWLAPALLLLCWRDRTGRHWPAWAGWPGLALAVLLALRLNTMPGLDRFLPFAAAVQREDWARVRDLAERLPRRTMPDTIGYGYIRALEHAGRLGEDLFRVPQRPYCLLSLVDPAGPRMYYVDLRVQNFSLLGDLLLRLGLVNEAEHEAIEAYEIYGPLPAATERLALINVLKGRPEAARVWLRNLLPVPLAGRRAAALLDRLQLDPTLREDPLLQQVRARQLRTDRGSGLFELEVSLRDLLADHPDHRLAWEYLQTWHLLTRRPAAVAAEAGRWRRLGLAGLPTLYQQAVAVEEALQGRPLPASAAVSPAVREQFAQFLRALQVDPGDLAQVAGRAGAPAESLWRQFGTTYFFYHVFYDSGLTP
ncbi:MAG: hypothetical protein IT204_07210 [Fimbriimonadaceae bacterium]|nr:hypothetical protein [Fimbriimonadaceae bacterium]